LLECQVEAADIELLKHSGNHGFPIFLTVARGIGEQNMTFLGRHLQLIKESMMPHFLHIWPIFDNSVDDGFG